MLFKTFSIPRSRSSTTSPIKKKRKIKNKNVYMHLLILTILAYIGSRSQWMMSNVSNLLEAMEYVTAWYSERNSTFLSGWSHCPLPTRTLISITLKHVWSIIQVDRGLPCGKICLHWQINQIVYVSRQIHRAAVHVIYCIAKDSPQWRQIFSNSGSTGRWSYVVTIGDDL